MKKLLMSAAILFLFALSVLIIQSSCSKSEAAPISASQLNKIIFIKRNPTTTSMAEIWIANYDGSNSAIVPISLPSGVFISYDLNTVSVKLSPDGQSVFFSGYDQNENKNGIYSCQLDGSNLTRIIAGNINENVMLGGAY